MSAAAEMAAGVLPSTGLASFVSAAVGMRERAQLVGAGASRSRIESTTAHHMAFIWAWGALSLFVLYAFVLSWHEWWRFCLGFAVVGALCFGFASLLGRDADAGRDDETLLTLGRYLGMGQLAGMLATLLGLAIDPDKEILWPKDGDWAANAVFLTGALALAALTAHALVVCRPVGAPSKG
jgi:hypothetical protein